MKSTLKLFVLVFFIVINLKSFSQQNNNKVLLKIDNQSFTLEEFMYVYTKNNVQGEVIDKKNIDEYLDLYINFRLKVKEAESKGLDTMKSFLDELKGYRATLAKPYLSNSSVDEEIMKEAYQRLQYDVRASHIMVSLDENISENDEQAKAAYNKLIDLRNRALKGESFAYLASKYSEDPSARDLPASQYGPAQKGNSGDLGYFTAFNMVYPFESAVYNTKIGEISMPIRTQYGYHIVMVTDKIEALGKIKVEHINVKIHNNDTLQALAKIKEIKTKISSGDLSFEEAAKQYSDDKGSATNGGMLPWFEVGKMVPEFISNISKLKNLGDVSEPVLTDYGYHLVKLIELKKIASYEEYLPELKQRIAKDSRSAKSKEVAIESFKKEFNFQENPKTLTAFYKVVDTTILAHIWKIEKAKKLKKTMFTLDGKLYTQKDFAEYLEKNQNKYSSGSVKYVVDQYYKNWVDEIVYNYKDSKLEEQDFKFKMLVKEYHDGILLFTISDDEVWSKAVKDSIGLEAFYQANKEKYMWKKRVDAMIYKCANDSVATACKKLLDKGLDIDSVAKILNKTSKLNLNYEFGKYEIETHDIFKKLEIKTGYSSFVKSDKGVVFVKIDEILPAQPKKLSEARGIITADYQTYLDKTWIESLRKKYKVEVDKSVLPN